MGENICLFHDWREHNCILALLYIWRGRSSNPGRIVKLMHSTYFFILECVPRFIFIFFIFFLFFNIFRVRLNRLFSFYMLFRFLCRFLLLLFLSLFFILFFILFIIIAATCY
ncbi:ORF349 [White spot syndrome virus]|nr:ORF349 [White spot syndrome virus]